MKPQFTRIFRYLDCSARKAHPWPRQGKYKRAHRQGPARSLTVNLRFWCCSAVAALAAFDSAYAQPTDDSLRIYAVNIIQDPPQPWTGYGIYLGKGLVITAAHVVGLAAQTKPSVRIAGMDLPAHAIKENHGVDLTLLSIDEEKLPIYLQMRRMPLCEKLSRVGEPVIVAIPESTARSRIMSPQLLSPNIRKKFPTVISDVATTGNSGSGVFDAGSKCLLGIVSAKIFVQPKDPDAGGEQKDIAKYFVPASSIRAFIPTEYRF
jgi:S1-C subfamily serine protease